MMGFPYEGNVLPCSQASPQDGPEPHADAAAPGNAKPHNKSLDGLRGLAALSVAIFHFFCGFAPYLEAGFHPDIFKPLPWSNFWVTCLQYPPLSLFHNGHFAVSIFFVLSGYVLSLPFFDKKRDDFRLKARIVGRYFRLNIPIAFAILAAFGLVMLKGFCFDQVSAITGSNWMSSWPESASIAEVAKQVVYKGVVFGKSGLIPVLWTLRIEFLGSILLLIYLLLTSKKSQFMAVVYALVVYFVFKQEAFYYLLFLAGMLLGFRGSLGGLMPQRKLASAALVVGLLIGSYTHQGFYEWLPVVSGFWVPFWDMSVFWHGIGAVLLVFSVTRGSCSYFLQSDWAVFLGKVSYSLYLVHMILLGTVASWLFVHLPRNVPILIAELLVYLTISLLAAWLMYRHIDRFSLRFSHAFAKAVVEG
jgi:peptidoglycan/LPS O-acetylase OafA/YrhL